MLSLAAGNGRKGERTEDEAIRSACGLLPCGLLGTYTAWNLCLVLARPARPLAVSFAVFYLACVPLSSIAGFAIGRLVVPPPVFPAKGELISERDYQRTLMLSLLAGAAGAVLLKLI